MAQIRLANFADTTLASGISAAATTVSLATGTGALFPALTGGDWFYAVLVDTLANREIVKVTAIAGDAATIVRAQESTTAKTFAVGSLFSLRLTIQSFQDYVASVALTSAGAATLSNKNLDATNTFPSNVAQLGVAQSFTASQKSAIVTDNDLSLDLSAAGNDYSVTPTAGGTLAFTNIAANTGKSGHIKFVNGTSYAIAKGSNIKCSTTLFTTISTTGTYIIGYWCDGTDVYLTTSGAAS